MWMEKVSGMIETEPQFESGGYLRRTPDHSIRYTHQHHYQPQLIEQRNRIVANISKRRSPGDTLHQRLHIARDCTTQRFTFIFAFYWTHGITRVCAGTTSRQCGRGNSQSFRGRPGPSCLEYQVRVVDSTAAYGSASLWRRRERSTSH